jgi:hypothetical protein
MLATALAASRASLRNLNEGEGGYGAAAAGYDEEGDGMVPNSSFSFTAPTTGEEHEGAIFNLPYTYRAYYDDQSDGYVDRVFSKDFIMMERKTIIVVMWCQFMVDG